MSTTAAAAAQLSGQNASFLEKVEEVEQSAR